MPGEPGRGADVMELTLLTVPDCPNAAAFEERLPAAPAGPPGAGARRRALTGDPEAAGAGVHGSPALVIAGPDPSAAPRPPAAPSCRPPPAPAGPTRGRAV